MTNIKLHYLNGVELMVEDVVLVNETRTAYIEKLLLPGTKEADDYSTPEGGFLLHFEDGDLQAWSKADEDIQFVKRGAKVEA